jgi:hypothetical protein
MIKYWNIIMIIIKQTHKTNPASKTNQLYREEGNREIQTVAKSSNNPKLKALN